MPLLGSGGPLQPHGRSPAGRGRWWRVRRLEPGPGRRGTSGSPREAAGTRHRRRRPSPPAASTCSHGHWCAPATPRRAGAGPRRPRTPRSTSTLRCSPPRARAGPEPRRRGWPRASSGSWPPACSCAGPGSPARPDPLPARRPRRPARGGSPPMARRSARTTRWPAGAAQGRRRAAHPAGAPAARPRRAGDSDTTGGGRQAGPGTGSLAPAPPAWPCHPSWPVTASHSGPLSRSRTEVCSRKCWTCSGWRCRTSSAR